LRGAAFDLLTVDTVAPEFIHLLTYENGERGSSVDIARIVSATTGVTDEAPKAARTRKNDHN
jgi:hypothetical protein